MRHRFSPIYLIDALRSPVGKLGGSLAHWRPDDLAAQVVKGLTHGRTTVEKSHIDGLFLGCTNQAGEDNRNVARMASILAGLPAESTAVTLNSLCSSGLEAIFAAIRCVALGEGHCYLAGGVESMSRAPWIKSRTNEQLEDSTIGWRFVNPNLPASCPPLSMSETAEQVAVNYGITRQVLDNYAYQSRLRYQSAWEAGLWATELLPLRDAQGTGWVIADEPHRLLAPALLAKMPAIVRGGRCITAGNASRIGDGAALVAVASAEFVEHSGVQPLARVVDWQSAASAAMKMSYSAVRAAQLLLERHPIEPEAWQAIHWSESFAVQPLLGIQALGLPVERVNPHGGALSVGNPIAVGAARLVVSLAQQFMTPPQGQYGLAVTAGGLGTSGALLLERL